MDLSLREVMHWVKGWTDAEQNTKVRWSVELRSRGESGARRRGSRGSPVSDGDDAFPGLLRARALRSLTECPRHMATAHHPGWPLHVLFKLESYSGTSEMLSGIPLEQRPDSVSWGKPSEGLVSSNSSSVQS